MSINNGESNGKKVEHPMDSTIQDLGSRAYLITKVENQMDKKTEHDMGTGINPSRMNMPSSGMLLSTIIFR